MRPVPLRLAPLALVLLVFCCSSCKGGKRFYPVAGHIFADGKPAEGVTIVLHVLDDEANLQPIQPTAITQADGSFILKTFLNRERINKDGAPAGKYRVTCVWYPPDLEKYIGREILPDKLNGKYSNPKTSGLSAEVLEQPTDLPPFQLELDKRKPAAP